MKVDVKKIDPVRRELRFEIPRDRVTKEFEEIYAEFGKVAKIKGFRPGKAPRHLIEAQHGKLAEEEVIKKIIPQAYQEAIIKEKLAPLDLPEIGEVSLKNGILTFTVKLDIKPEVSVKNYKGIPVTRKSSTITDEEINKTLEFFKKGQGKDKEIIIDDAFSKGLGFPSLDEFKKTLTRQLEMDKDRQNRFDVENQIVDHLIKNAKLTVPQSIVAKQLEHRVHEAKHRLEHQGMSKDDIAKKEDEIRKDLKVAVEKDVQVYLILDKIAEEEKIEIQENENLAKKVIEFLLKEAKWEEAK